MASKAALALSCIFTVSSCGIANAQTSAAQWPAPVRTYIRHLDNTCRELDEAPDRKLSYVQRADVTGDGLLDYVIDDGDYMCGSTPYMLAGQAGAPNVVFVGTANGGATLAYEVLGTGIRIGKSKSGRPVALASTIGADCGASPKLKAAGSCERPLVWNPTTKMMTFGPPQANGY